MKPRIDRTNLNTVMVKAGKVVKFDVNIRGEPPPTVTWKLANQVVESKGNVEIENKDYNTKFTINDAVRKNSGKYTIIAENEHGKDEADVEVVVLGRLSCLIIRLIYHSDYRSTILFFVFRLSF